MTNDRFKYRIYDVENKRYVDNPEDFVPWDLPEGFTCELCSGVDDDGGHLIYDGDVLEFSRGERGFVYYENGAFMVWTFGADNVQFLATFIKFNWSMRITGNIHESGDK